MSLVGPLRASLLAVKISSLFRGFAFYNLGLVLGFYLPYVVWDFFFSGFISSLEDIKQKLKTNSDENVDNFTTITKQTLPSMDYLIYHQVFCELLTSVFTIYISWIYIDYFGFLHIKEDIITNPYLIVKTIEDKLPSIGNVATLIHFITVLHTRWRQKNKYYLPLKIMEIFVKLFILTRFF